MVCSHSRQYTSNTITLSIDSVSMKSVEAIWVVQWLALILHVYKCTEPWSSTQPIILACRQPMYQDNVSVWSSLWCCSSLHFMFGLKSNYMKLTPLCKVVYLQQSSWGRYSSKCCCRGQNRLNAATIFSVALMQVTV